MKTPNVRPRAVLVMLLPLLLCAACATRLPASTAAPVPTRQEIPALPPALAEQGADDLHLAEELGLGGVERLGRAGETTVQADVEAIALLAALSRAVGLWDPSAASPAPTSPSSPASTPSNSASPSSPSPSPSSSARPAATPSCCSPRSIGSSPASPPASSPSPSSAAPACASPTASKSPPRTS